MRYLLALLSLLCSCGFVFSQDVAFSQPGTVPLYINPALAGTKDGIRLLSTTRLQWMRVNGGIVTNYFSYDQYSKHFLAGIGADYYQVNESRGLFKSQFLRLNYSPSLPVGRRQADSLRPVVIKPGMYVALGSNTIDWNKMEFLDTSSSYHEVMNKEQVAYPDFGFGIAVYSARFVGGASAAHVTEPDQGFLFSGSPFPMAFRIHAAWLVQDDEWLKDFTLCPSLLWEQQEGWQRFNFSLNAGYKKYLLGLGVRMGKMFMVNAGVNLKVVRLGYSYDIPMSKAVYMQGSSHEITVGFNFANRKEKKEIRLLDWRVF